MELLFQTNSEFFTEIKSIERLLRDYISWNNLISLRNFKVSIILRYQTCGKV